MAAITLDVIMSGIFGIEGEPEPGSLEDQLRKLVHRFSAVSTTRRAQFFDLLSIGRTEPLGVMKAAIDKTDRVIYGIIAARRAEGTADRHDILSTLINVRDEQGSAMSDEELRDELVTLVLAGHETTANSLAWAFERLVRNPEPYARLREEVRSDSANAGDYIMATIHEAMRCRPVIPAIGRRVTVPWDLGEYRVPADTAVMMSTVLVHHREDLYPDPFSFRPERFLGVKPGTYTWIPFGGGIRRCIGASLALAEQRVVLDVVTRRADLRYVDPAPEKVLHRNVTMIPSRGATVAVERKA
jgi:cytochrome P450